MLYVIYRNKCNYFQLYIRLRLLPPIKKPNITNVSKGQNLSMITTEKKKDLPFGIILEFECCPMNFEILRIIFRHL